MKRESISNQNSNMSVRSSQFSMVLIVAALLLMTLPFINTVNEFMTTILIKLELYRLLEDFVVPYESKILAGVFSLFPVSAWATSEGVWLNGTFLRIEWNCIGWQSGILLIATYFTGLGGNFTRQSRVEAIIIGVLGTFLVNFIRLAIVGVFSITFGQVAATVFHDYFSLAIIVSWFIFFWWFSYSFVLEERRAAEEEVGKGEKELGGSSSAPI
jgi:exosortase/archaeosortase family protein